MEGKKGFFARINEALYETVETDGSEGALRREQPGNPEPAPPAADTDAEADAEQPLAVTPDLGARVRQDIAGRGPALAQFLALAGSFTEIIPEESGRYRAAMKALEKTGNITRAEVLKAGNDQLRALDSQREVFSGTLSRKREELKAQGGGVEGIRAQIAELQQSIARLRQEEQGLLQRIAADESKFAAAQEGFSALLGSLEAEIKGSLEMIEKYVPE